MRLLTAALVLMLGAAAPRDASPRQSAGAEVFLRTNFDGDAVSVQPEGNAAIAIVSAPDQALVGQSLLVTRKAQGGYFGAHLDLNVERSADLRIAFTVRAREMRHVTVNVFDAARGDNATPASPARIDGTDWRMVVLYAEDFHYNSDPPDRKVGGNERFVSLLLHGQETAGTAEIAVDNLVVYRGPDRLPPAAPTTLEATVTGDGVDLRWTEPADDTLAAVYTVQRMDPDGTWSKVGESFRPSFRDRTPSAGSYRYRVLAADYENNLSAPSSEILVTTTTGSLAAVAASPVVQDRIAYASHLREIHARGRASNRPGAFLFAGDSITAATSYTHILGSWLGRGLTIRQGVSAVTTAYGAERMPQYLRDGRPEFAVIMYGTNDRGDVRGSMRNLSSIIDACLAAGTVPILSTIPPRGYSKRQGDQEAFNRALVALARSRRIPVSYAFEEMMQHDLRDILSDGVHLTPEAGNEAAGRALRRTMDQIAFALRDN